MKKSIFAIILIASMSIQSCTNEKHFEKGKRQLEMQGYTNIENTGYSAFCCSDKDDFSTGFKCKDKQGNTVKGCICSGLLKGITIRFE